MFGVLGIDPGVKGCLWYLDENGNSGRWIDMPVYRNELVVDKTTSFFQNFSPETTLIVLEKTFYTPILRGKKAFSFGRMTMGIEIIPLMLGFEVVKVLPSVWQNEYGLANVSGKTKSVLMAMRLNPKFQNKFAYNRANKKVLKDGRADAFLIAEYGKRYFLDDFIKSKINGGFNG